MDAEDGSPDAEGSLSEDLVGQESPLPVPSEKPSEPARGPDIDASSCHRVVLEIPVSGGVAHHHVHLCHRIEIKIVNVSQTDVPPEDQRSSPQRDGCDQSLGLKRARLE